jgi:CMP-N-acetylneuraminic acid synthetase
MLPGRTALRTIGLIPARGGSSRIPRKNLRLLGGRPLLQHTVEVAQRARRLSGLLLSTDDEEIAALGRRLGVDVPFLRPPDLAEGDTPMLAAVQHAIRWLEAAGERVDAVCLLQPTAPFRTADQIDGCIDLLERANHDAVVTIVPVPVEYHPDWAYRRRPDGTLRLWTGGRDPVTRRQDLEIAYCRSGDVYVTRRDTLIEQSSLYGSSVAGYPIDPAGTVNLNDPDDWDRAERALALRGAAAAR